MWFIVRLLWIVSLSSSHTPLEFHLLPYRWHYPTPIVGSPTAINCAAPHGVDHDAPSGREVALKDKDKYGEDYILEEIEFSHSDIGYTGKLDYYIDEGIEYYDVDIFASSYSGEKTPPKPSSKFGANEEHGRQVDVLDRLRLAVQNNQDGRHFNSYIGRPDERTSHQNTDRHISLGSRIGDFEGNSGQDNHDGRHVSVQDVRPGYHTTYQNIHRPISGPRIEVLNSNYRPNNQDSGNFNPQRGSSGYQTQYQATERTISTFQDYNNQDGRHLSQHGGNREYQDQYQSTDRTMLDSRIQGQNNEDGRHFNTHGGSPVYQTTYQNTDRPISEPRIQGQQIQDGRNFNRYDGSPEQHLSHYHTTHRTMTDPRIQAPNNQDVGHFDQYGGAPEYQTPHLRILPSIVTSSKAVNGGHFLYKLSRRGQELQGKLKARVENKDEIMDAVE